MKRNDMKNNMVVKLSRDVENPRPDRRKSRDWSAAPVWPKGLRLVVNDYSYLSLTYDSCSVGPGTEGFEELIDACVPAADTFDNLMLGLNGGSRFVDVSRALLFRLVEMGVVTLNDIRSAHNEEQRADGQPAVWEV